MQVSQKHTALFKRTERERYPKRCKAGMVENRGRSPQA